MLDRIRGSHHILIHPEHQRAVPVPVHGRELKRGTLLAIIRTAGVDRDELRQLLDE